MHYFNSFHSQVLYFSHNQNKACNGLCYGYPSAAWPLRKPTMCLVLVISQLCNNQLHSILLFRNSLQLWEGRTLLTANSSATPWRWYKDTLFWDRKQKSTFKVVWQTVYVQFSTEGNSTLFPQKLDNDCSKIILFCFPKLKDIPCLWMYVWLLYWVQ